MPGNDALPTCTDSLAALARRFAALVQGLAFWTAIVLPLLYLPPLLVGTSFGTRSLVGALIAVNVVAAVVGHGYTGTVREVG